MWLIGIRIRWGQERKEFLDPCGWRGGRLLRFGHNPFSFGEFGILLVRVALGAGFGLLVGGYAALVFALALFLEGLLAAGELFGLGKRGHGEKGCSAGEGEQEPFHMGYLTLAGRVVFGLFCPGVQR